MKLTNIACKNAKPREKAYKMADGAGMYLEVAPNGSKYWRMKYKFMGKENRLSFGVYPDVSLLEAREKRDIAKKQLREDKDPVQVRKEAKLERKINYENNFEAVAREWHTKKNHSWQPKHAATIMTRLETYIFRKIGSRPIKLVTPPKLLEAIRPIEKQGKHEMAHRMLQTCGQILRYAVQTGGYYHYTSITCANLCFMMYRDSNWYFNVLPPHGVSHLRLLILLKTIKFDSFSIICSDTKN